MPGWEKSTNQFKYRIIDSDRFDSKSFRTIALKDFKGINAVVGKLKKSFAKKKNTDSLYIQSYWFDKNVFDIPKAKKWAKTNIDQVFNINDAAVDFNQVFETIKVPNEPVYILVKYVEGLGWVQLRDLNQGQFRYVTDSHDNSKRRILSDNYNKFLLDAKINNYICDDFGQPLEATVLVTQGAIQNLNQREYTPESLELAVEDVQKLVRLGLLIGYDGHPGGAVTEGGDVFGFDYTEKEPLYRVVALWYDKESQQVWAKIRFFNTPLAIAYCDKLRRKEDVYVSLRALGPCEFINGQQVCSIDRIDGFDVVENPALPTAKMYSINEVGTYDQTFIDSANSVNKVKGSDNQLLLTPNIESQKAQLIIDEISCKCNKTCDRCKTSSVIDSEQQDQKDQQLNMREVMLNPEDLANLSSDENVDGLSTSLPPVNISSELSTDEDVTNDALITKVRVEEVIPNSSTADNISTDDFGNLPVISTDPSKLVKSSNVVDSALNTPDANNLNLESDNNSIHKDSSNINILNHKVKFLDFSKFKSKQSKPLIASASNAKGVSLMLKQILARLEQQGIDQRTLGRMEAAFAIGGVEALNSMLAQSEDIPVEMGSEFIGGEPEMEAEMAAEMDADPAEFEGDPNVAQDPNAENTQEETQEEEGQTVAGESEEGTVQGEEDAVAEGGKPVRPRNSRYAMMQEEVASDGTTPTKTIKTGTDETDSVEDGAEEVGVPIDNPNNRTPAGNRTPPVAEVNPKPTMAYVDKSNLADKRVKDKTSCSGKNLRTTNLPVKAKHPGGKSNQEPVNLYAKSQGMKDMTTNNKNQLGSPLAKFTDNARNFNTRPINQVNQGTQRVNQALPELPNEYKELFAEMKAIVSQKKLTDAVALKESAIDNIINSGKCDNYDLGLLPVALVNKQKTAALADASDEADAVRGFKTRIGTLIDAQMNNLVSVGASRNFIAQGSSVNPEFIKDDQSWMEWDEKLNKSINDNRRVYRPRTVLEVEKRAEVNNSFILDMLKAWDKVPDHRMYLSDWARDQKAAMRSGKITDAALVIGANDFRNQPVIARVIIRQVFQRLMTLQLVQALGPGRAIGSPGAGGLPFGGEFKFPVLSYNSPAHNRKRYVNGTDPIPQASSNIRFESFFARMRALSFAVEDELRNQLQNGALGIDPVAIMLDDVTQDMARAIDTHLLEEHQQTCDEYGAVAVVSELSIIGNTVYSAGANVTITYDGQNYVYPNGVFAVKLLAGAAGGIPIVLPRATTIYDQTGAQVQATLNPITVTFASTTQVMGELDDNLNVVSSNPITTTDSATTFAPDYEKGYLIFKANSGANGTLMPTTSYSYVTNYKSFNLNVTSGVLPEDYYDGLLNLLMLTAGEMDQFPRYRQPDICLFPSNIAMGTIGISSLFHKRKSPDGLALARGFAQTDTLGEIHGIEMMRTNGRMFAGDRRAILFQRYMVGYGVQMPAIIKGPYNNYYANANGIVQPTAGENWALEMRDVVGTPLPRNASNVVINHPGITIRFSGRVSAV